jgi:hypothetical protein
VETGIYLFVGVGFIRPVLIGFDESSPYIVKEKARRQGNSFISLPPGFVSIVIARGALKQY